MKRSQEYIKSLDSNKKKEFEELLKKEGSKSKFRTKIQMTIVYILASVFIFISMLVIDYLLSENNHLAYVVFIVFNIFAIFLYVLYFWKWMKDYLKIQYYVQPHWFKLYYWVFGLTIVNYFVSFICSVFVLTNSNSGFILDTSNNGAYQGFNLYLAIIIGLVIEVLFSLFCVGLDTYVIYHLEVDIQRLIKEYDDDQIDYLKEKIKQEANKLTLSDNDSSDITSSSLSHIEKDEQKPLTQEEIDTLLKQNSLFDNEKESDKQNE